MIVFDFDNTLFDTPLLKQDLRDLVMQLLSVDEEYFWQTLRESYVVFPELPGVYTIEGHHRVLSKDYALELSSFKQAIKDMVLQRGIGYLYPDVIPTLEQLAKDHELYLVTKGEDFFQNLKLEATGLRQFFSSVHIVPSGKQEVLHQLLTDQMLINVNDHVEEMRQIKERFPQVQCVVVNRDGRHDTLVCEFPVVTDITKIL